jgi:hypothetical protein
MNSMLVILSLGIGLLPGAEALLLPIPTHENISYGPHARNTLDFWQAKGDGPRPLLVYIHGGGRGQHLNLFSTRGFRVRHSITG